MEGLHGVVTGLLLKGFQQEGFQLFLEALDEDVPDVQQAAGLGFKVHNDLLVDGVVAAFTVVDVGQIDQRALAAFLRVAIDDVVVVIPRQFVLVVAVLVVEGQQRPQVVGGIVFGKGLGRLLHIVVVTVEQSFGDGGVDDLSGSAAAGSGLFESDVHAARR